MAARKCPQCLTTVSMGQAAAFTDKIECPGCKSTLEVSAISRHLAIWAGLLAGVLAWSLTRGGHHTWMLPVAYSILAFGLVAAFATMYIADLRVRPPKATPELGDSSGQGHGGGHH